MIIKGPAFLLWAWESIEKQISCLALSLRMIKNRVNPEAAGGTSSCEGERGKQGRGEGMGGKGRRRRAGRAAALREDSVCSSLG